MFNKETSAITRAKRSLNKKMTFAGFGVILAIIVCGIIVWRFAETERARDLYNWQVRTGLVADRQQAEVTSWVERQFLELSKLADNPSLQLYMTELELMNHDALGEMVTEEPAETVFLRNLLTVTAERGGFLALQTESPEIKANVDAQGGAGIALIDNSGKIIASTKGLPILEDKLANFMSNLPKGKKVLLDMYKGYEDAPTMAFAVPVFSIQGDKEAAQQIGLVLGVKMIGDEVFPLLKVPYPGYETAESILVRVEDGSIDYISPLQNGKEAMTTKMAVNTPELVEARAINSPGEFFHDNDYRFKQVLATGRKIEGTPWTLIHKVDYREAMKESNARITRLVSVFILAVMVVIVGLIAAWRHGSSLKSEKVALRYKNLFTRFKSQEHLLRLVSDNQPDAMFLVDAENKYCYANQKAAKDAGVSNFDIVGKTISSVLGPNKANVYQEFNAKALNHSATVSHIQGFADKVLQVKHIPLVRIPNLIAEEETPGVLVIEQDITELVREREKQHQTLDQLINSLVSLVDRHDPYAAHHSSRVSKLAKAIAEEIGLDEVMIETAQVAGRLMNVGKILLPAGLLTKKDHLSEQEKKDVNESIYASAAFLKDITFDGPVVETIDQCLEHWDGSGPKGLKGEDIIITARIVAVSNAYVAMISPRAYRKKMTKDEVMNNLLKDVDRKFQRSIVAALINYIENHDTEEDFELEE